MREVLINGRFLAAKPAGVQRVAAGLITGMDACLSDATELAEPRFTLIKPVQAQRDMPLARILTRTAGRLNGQPWEQIELPWLARGATLVNLCNLGPLTHPRSITMIHDAQVFLSPHSYSRAFRSWYMFALPRIGARALKILTVSEYSRQQLIQFKVAPADRIVVVPNGVDHLRRVAPDQSVLNDLNLAQRPFVLGLANTQTHKNVSLLLKAFASPRLSEVTLVLMGPASEADFAALGLHLPPNVVIAGLVTDGQMRSLMEAARALAFPSTTEGFGLPPLEAMSLGCPTIVAPCGALPEVCGEASLYAGPDDVEAWVAGIAQLVEDPDASRAKSNAGLEQAAKFTWAKSSTKLLNIIKSLS